MKLLIQVCAKQLYRQQVKELNLAATDKSEFVICSIYGLNKATDRR
ncbi:MAG: hypothetical protein OFPII_42360 [Osedax symbiont Rs1]|nr:MAG: hypothetical protein OFPII_42360 [Osedax symbiont Rs1]